MPLQVSFTLLAISKLPAVGSRRSWLAKLGNTSLSLDPSVPVEFQRSVERNSTRLIPAVHNTTQTSMPSSAFEVPPTRTAASPRENPTSFAHVILAPNEGGHERFDKPWSKWNKFLTREGFFLKLGTKFHLKFLVHEWLHFQFAKVLHLDYISAFHVFIRDQNRHI